MDDWDPKVTNGFAAEREVILFDNAGVAGSTGETPSTVAPMGLKLGEGALLVSTHEAAVASHVGR